MPRLLSTAAALLGAASIVSAAPSARAQKRQDDIIAPLPEAASDLEFKFQPLLDFDTDGCYNTAAIDGSGTINAGDGATSELAGDCRDPVHLENSNAYSRSRCNNGI